MSWYYDETYGHAVYNSHATYGSDPPNCTLTYDYHLPTVQHQPGSNYYEDSPFEDPHAEVPVPEGHDDQPSPFGELGIVDTFDYEHLDDHRFDEIHYTCTTPDEVYPSHPSSPTYSFPGDSTDNFADEYGPLENHPCHVEMTDAEWAVTLERVSKPHDVSEPQPLPSPQSQTHTPFFHDPYTDFERPEDYAGHLDFDSLTDEQWAQIEAVHGDLSQIEVPAYYLDRGDSCCQPDLEALACTTAADQWDKYNIPSDAQTSPNDYATDCRPHPWPNKPEYQPPSSDFEAYNGLSNLRPHPWPNINSSPSSTLKRSSHSPSRFKYFRHRTRDPFHTRSQPIPQLNHRQSLVTPFRHRIRDPPKLKRDTERPPWLKYAQRNHSRSRNTIHMICDVAHTSRPPPKPNICTSSPPCLTRPTNCVHRRPPPKPNINLPTARTILRQAKHNRRNAIRRLKKRNSLN